MTDDPRDRPPQLGDLERLAAREDDLDSGDLSPTPDGLQELEELPSLLAALGDFEPSESLLKRGRAELLEHVDRLQASQPLAAKARRLGKWWQWLTLVGAGGAVAISLFVVPGISSAPDRPELAHPAPPRRAETSGPDAAQPETGASPAIWGAKDSLVATQAQVLAARLAGQPGNGARLAQAERDYRGELLASLEGHP